MKSKQQKDLTEKERNYIISELICSTDSCCLYGKDFTIKNFEKAKFKDFDMEDESEFELIKSIIRKLNKGDKGKKS